MTRPPSQRWPRGEAEAVVEEAAEEAEKDEHAEEAGGDLTQEQKDEVKVRLILTRDRLREDCRARQLRVGRPVSYTHLTLPTKREV